MSHQPTQPQPAEKRDLRFARGSREAHALWPAWLRTHPQPAALPTALGAYAMCVVLAVFPSVLKIIKVVHVARDGVAIADLLRVLSSDLAVASASMAIFMLGCRVSSRLRHGAWLYASISTAYLLVVLELTALEHQTWAQSSSLLDWNVLWYTAKHYAEMRPIIAAETTATGVLLLLGGGVLAVAPVIADVWTARVLGVGMRPSPRATFAGFSCAVVLALGASGSPKAPELCPLSQSASLGLIAGAFHAAKKVVAGSAHFSVPNTGRSAERLKQALATAHFALDTSTAHPKNVLLVVLESTRFDATSVYVPRLQTTPRLVELAQHGVVVERAYADMPHTSKALVAIVCGYSPRYSVQVSETEPGGLDRPCMPHLLGALGYRRAFFQAAVGTFEDRHQFALNAGFEQVFTRESYDETGFEEVNYLSVEDKVMVQPIMRWIDEQKTTPFFATILTCITHHSYGLPSRFHVREYPREPALFRQRMPRPWADYNRYLNTVEYADELLGDLLDGLRARGRLDDTLVVVVGDHGQGFDEHGQRAHNTVIWDEGLHVPLVIGNAKLFPEQRLVDGVRRQEDIAPTIFSQLGISSPAGFFEGHDLLSGPPHQYAYSACWYDQRCAAETGARLRVIDHFENRPMEVYDLSMDPIEHRDLLRVGSQRDRGHFEKVAAQARYRMQAHQRELEQRYSDEREDAQAFLLEKPPTPTYPMRALLGDFVELIGYDAPTHEVVPDSFWDAVVYFECKKPSDEGWRLFGMLETFDGRSEQTDHHPANGRLYLHQCKPGTIVADPIHVWIPGDFPPGEARYWWGAVFLKELGHAGGENPRIERSDVISLERGLLAHDDALLLARLHVKAQYRPELAALLKSSVLTRAPKIDKPLDVRFGKHLVLLDLRVAPRSPRRLASVTVTTVWRVEGKQDGPWQIAVSIESKDERRSVHRAHTPVDGIHPIANWQPGTFVLDSDSVPVLEKIRSGDATIWLSVSSESERMRIDSAGHAHVEDNRVLAAKIQIKD